MITAVVDTMSRALGRHVSYSIAIPDAKDAGPGPYHVLYQLHGASDNHAAWINRSNLARYTARMPLVVVCPDGGLSFWMNVGSRERYEDFLIFDLPEHLANTYNIVTGKAAIGGLSMGGFGALRLALKYPERFASVWAHSSAVWTAEELKNNRFHADMQIKTPEAQERFTIEADIYALADKVKNDSLPEISFDCGSEDFLIKENRRFHKHLETIGIRHTYKEHPGIHSWDYWDIHVKEALLQHARVLGLPGAP